MHSALMDVQSTRGFGADSVNTGETMPGLQMFSECQAFVFFGARRMP